MLKNIFVSLLVIFQEIFIPFLGPMRSLLPITFLLNPFYFLLSTLLVVSTAYYFEIYSTNFFISVVSLTTPFLLLTSNYTKLNVNLLISIVTYSSFLAMLLQLFLPGFSNDIFVPFTNSSYVFEGFMTRATIFSMEPSFAAEMIFPFLMLLIYFFKSIRFNFLLLTIFTAIIFFVRASTFAQQVYIFTYAYLFFSYYRLPIGEKLAFRVLAYFLYLFSMVLFFIVFYQLIIGLKDNTNFINDSLDVYGSWRTISNLSCIWSADLMSFFSSLDYGSWEDKITNGSNSIYNGVQNISWIIQPFSLFAVYLIDFGVFGFLIIFLAMFYVVFRNVDFESQTTLQKSVLFSLITNTYFFSPKWQLTGFLIIGLIISNLNNKKDIYADFCS